MRDDEGLDASDKKLLDDVDQFGWHVLLIQPTDTEPAFAFSVGLWHTFRHPEVCVIGLTPDVAHRIVNLVGDRAKRNEPVPIASPTRDFVEGYAVEFRPVARRHYVEYFGYALWFYRDDNFPVLQCVWPDKSGRWPWEAQFDARWRTRQPVLDS